MSTKEWKCWRSSGRRSWCGTDLASAEGADEGRPTLTQHHTGAGAVECKLTLHWFTLNCNTSTALHWTPKCGLSLTILAFTARRHGSRSLPALKFCQKLIIIAMCVCPNPTNVWSAQQGKAIGVLDYWMSQCITIQCIRIQCLTGSVRLVWLIFGLAGANP